MNTSELKRKFYSIADNGNRVTLQAMSVMDTLGASCSPDHYNNMILSEVKQALKWDDDNIWKEWYREIIAAVEACPEEKDLRGFQKNIHHKSQGAK